MKSSLHTAIAVVSSQCPCYGSNEIEPKGHMSCCSGWGCLIQLSCLCPRVRMRVGYTEQEALHSSAQLLRIRTCVLTAAQDFQSLVVRMSEKLQQSRAWSRSGMSLSSGIVAHVPALSLMLCCGVLSLCHLQQLLITLLSPAVSALPC